MSTEVPNLDGLGGDGTPALPSRKWKVAWPIWSTVFWAVLTHLAIRTSRRRVARALPEIPEGDLLGTLSSGISSGADALGGELGGLPGLPTDGLPS